LRGRQERGSQEAFKNLSKNEFYDNSLSQGSHILKKKNKLFTGSSDRTIRIWDCNIGQCARVIELGADIGLIISEGACVFIGMPKVVKVSSTLNMFCFVLVLIFLSLLSLIFCMIIRYVCSI